MLQGFLEFGVGLLPFDGDAEQARKARKEIGIRKIELTRVSTVDLENAKWQMAFATSRDQDVDGGEPARP